MTIPHDRLFLIIPLFVLTTRKYLPKNYELVIQTLNSIWGGSKSLKWGGGGGGGAQGEECACARRAKSCSAGIVSDMVSILFIPCISEPYFEAIWYKTGFKKEIVDQI